jgi:hypothetical protein
MNESTFLVYPSAGGIPDFFRVCNFEESSEISFQILHIFESNLIVFAEKTYKNTHGKSWEKSTSFSLSNKSTFLT